MQPSAVFRTNMKRLYLIIILIFNLKSAKADYESIRLPQLISNSSLILRGKIEKVDSLNIIVKIQAQLKGTFTDSIIIISKFSDWTCAARFDNYSEGQKLIFFLKKGVKSYLILGAGNEGEMPIIDNKVYYKQLYLKIDQNPIEYKVYNGNLKGYEYNLNQFESAIIYYIKNSESIIKAILKDRNFNLTSMKNQTIDRIISELRDQYYSE
jgi:hypothetical protein